MVAAWQRAFHTDETKRHLIRTAVTEILQTDNITRWNDMVCPNKETAVAVMRQAEINLGLRPVEVELNERVAVPI